MEFVQFHPTGMVWPPSVRGILVTEGVRGEGGILKNNRGRAASCSTTSPRTTSRRPRTTRKRAGATRRATRTPRRPPELLTRDHVARCIIARGQGGARLAARRRVPRHRVDQGEASKTRAEHIKKKLPRMYHQFKELADVDITKEPMEVGPTTHYIMGGMRVDADTQMSTRAGPVRRRRVRGGHQRRQPPRRQLAVGSARVRQARRRVRGEVRQGAAARRARSTRRRSTPRRKRALAPFEREGSADGPVPDPARRCRR